MLQTVACQTSVEPKVTKDPQIILLKGKYMNKLNITLKIDIRSTFYFSQNPHEQALLTFHVKKIQLFEK